MLIGFFKARNDVDCECRVIKYVDRIWLLNDRGDAKFRRQFIVEVAPDSSKSLGEIRIAIPAENLTEVYVINKECFDENLIFNSPHILTTNKYEVIKRPQELGSFGIIEDDVNGKVKVFNDISYSIFKVGVNTPNVCNIIRLPLPAPLEPGERTEIRVVFKISSMFDTVNPESKFPINSIRLDYFMPCTQDLASIDGYENEIKVLPELEHDNPDHPGGFDIWLYFSPNYGKVGGFSNTSLEVYNEVHNFNGEKGEKRQKLGWKLRYLPIAKDKNLIGSGDSFYITGQLAEIYDSQKALEKIKEGLPTIQNTGKWSLLISILAIIISIIAMVLTFTRC